VRYRVTRFRELTGLDIRRTHDLVTTWWLLEWRRTRRRSRTLRGAANSVSSSARQLAGSK
jgi:hypothetical protein